MGVPGNKYTKVGLTLMLIALIISLGYLRDFIFVNINFMLAKLKRGEEFEGHSFFDFLHGYDYWELYYSKFFLTGIFTVLFCLIGIAFLYIWFRKRNYLKWFLLLYGGTLILSILFFGGGYLVGAPYQGYDLARIFMGYLQSPVPLMMFVPVLLFYERERTKE